MSENSNIEWTNHTWNVVTGCTKVSPGCDNCYEEVLAERFRGQPAFPVGFDVQLREHKMYWPLKLKLKQPARIFVNSMSDLFHRDIPAEYVLQVFEVMAAAHWHQFQVLTKRAHRMAYFLDKQGISVPENVWLGVSAENQEMAASRLPALLDIRVAVRFVSAEPLLGPVDLTPWLPGLAWVIVGGESGTRRRPMDYDWARRIRDDCQAAAVHFFYKQGNARRPGQDRLLDGTTHDALPRQLPPERSEYAGAVR